MCVILMQPVFPAYKGKRGIGPESGSMAALNTPQYVVGPKTDEVVASESIHTLEELAPAKERKIPGRPENFNPIKEAEFVVDAKTNVKICDQYLKYHLSKWTIYRLFKELNLQLPSLKIKQV